jgi:sister-chromatid-cohesion protein PDS5
MFFDQLRGLGAPTSPNYASYLYLLESFSMVNTHLILVEWDSDDMVIQLFRLCFELTAQDLAGRIVSYILTILSTSLTETEAVSDALLCVILEQLTPPLRSQNPHGYQLAINLVRRCEGELERPIVTFLRDHAVLGQELEDVETTLTNRTNQLELVYELCVNCPELLISLHPNFQDLMEGEEAEERRKWVELFGRIFTASDALAAKFPQLLTSFTKRLSDIDVNVRSMAAEVSGQLLIKYPTHRGDLNKVLEERSMDKEEKVRNAVCKSVCTAALADVGTVELALLNALGKRTMDKKLAIRQSAIDGLAQLFREHCSEYWKLGQGLPKSVKKFAWIPKRLITSSYLDNTNRLLVSAALDEAVMGIKFTVEERGRCMIGIYASFDEKNKQIFRSLLQRKVPAQECVRTLLDLRVQIKENQGDESFTKKQANKLHELASYLSAGETDAKIVKGLADMFASKDRNIRKWLAVLCDPLSPYDELRSAQKELARSMAVQTTKKKGQAPKKDSLAWKLGTMVGMTLLNVDSVAVLMALAEENITAKRGMLAVSAMELLQVQLSVFVLPVFVSFLAPLLSLPPFS